MLMNPPPADSSTTAAQNRGAIQPLTRPGIQRGPILGQNLMGIKTPVVPGMPQASVNPLDKQQQQALQMARLLSRG